MKIEDIEGAAKLRGEAIRRALQHLQTWATGIENAIGVDPLSAPGQGRLRVSPPPLARLTVLGGSGKFFIYIDLPPDALGPMLHELKVSDTLPFISSTTVRTYPLNPATYMEITDPNISRYFQLRSKYLTSDFNQPKVHDSIFSGAL